MTVSIEDAVQQLRESYSAAEKISTPCAVCGGTRLKLIGNRDRHGLGLQTRLCRHCSLAFTSPRPNEEWFEEFYKTFYWPIYIGSRFRDADDMFARDQCQERAAAILEGFTPDLKKQPSRCLDIGTGQGGMLAELKRRFPTSDVMGVEPSSDGVEYCRSRHGMEVHQLVWERINECDLPGPYDLITLIHVLEHVLDPLSCLQNAIGRLDEHGYLYIEVPDLLSKHWDGYGFLHIAHVTNFAEPSLTRLVQRAGGRVVKTYHGLAPLWPWAVGVLVQRDPAMQVSQHEVAPVSRRELQELESHVRMQLGQGMPTNSMSRLWGALRNVVARKSAA